MSNVAHGPLVSLGSKSTLGLKLETCKWHGAVIWLKYCPYSVKHYPINQANDSVFFGWSMIFSIVQLRRSWWYVRGIWIGTFHVSFWCRLLWCIQENTEDIAVEDPDVSFDIKSSGSPYGFQNCKSLVSSADLCVDVFVKVFSLKDFASTICELLNVL